MTVEEDGADHQPNGHALAFHPDLLRGTPLAQHMKNFNFFSYDAHEALHLSEKEKQVVFESSQKIELRFKRN